MIMQTFSKDENYEGRDNIALLLEKIEDENDIWLCYTLEGKSLNSNLFQVKGEFFKGERIYSV